MLLIMELPSIYGATTLCLSFHLLGDPWVFSTFLAIVNNGAMDICIQVFVYVPVFSSLGYICRSGIAGSHSHSVFNVLGNPKLLSTMAGPFYGDQLCAVPAWWE